MGETQNGPPVCIPGIAPSDTTPDRPGSLAAKADGEPSCAFGIDRGAELSGHALLSHAPAAQGRRSLFGR